MTESVKGVTKHTELNTKNPKELREICKTKEIDISTCFEKSDLVDLIIKVCDTDCFLTQLERVETQGDVSVILQGMLTHSDHATVQQQACQALVNLVQDNTMRVKIETTSVIEDVLGSMKAHKTSVLVQQQACAALKSLADNIAGMRVKIPESGGIETLVSVMKTHNPNVSVQEQVCVTQPWSVPTDQSRDVCSKRKFEIFRPFQ